MGRATSAARRCKPLGGPWGQPRPGAARLRALAGLLVYLIAAWAAPLGHQLHHRLDHDHRLGGTHWHRPGAAAPEPAVVAAELAATEAEHAALDAELAAVDLAEATHFGVMDVDCSLMRYTLVACADETAPPHSFGDEFAGREPHHHAPPPPPDDPHHGAGSLAHLAVALVGQPTFTLPPPARPLTALQPLPLALSCGATLARRPSARAPPAPPLPPKHSMG